MINVEIYIHSRINVTRHIIFIIADSESACQKESIGI